jgi:hypothetical protein
VGQQVLPFTRRSNSSSDAGWKPSQAHFPTETEALTQLCQTQINYWHSKSPLSKEQISQIMKYAKRTIMTRKRDSLDFIRDMNHGTRFRFDAH